jgi:hypothetical protein
VAQKVQNDLFDWAVQTNGQFNLELKAALIDNGGYAKDILDFVNEVKEDPKHKLFDNHVINIIESDPSKKASENTPNNIKVKGLDNKVYDQNNIIYAFRELRQYLKSQNELTGQNNQLYNNLVTLAVLQSGLSNSPISFTSVIPYEDFEKIYNKTLANLENISNLDDFYNIGVFQRNNWSNDDVVPYRRANWIEEKASGRMTYNPSMAYLSVNVKEAVANNTIPPVMTQSVNSREAVSDFIVYTWEKREDLLTEEEMENYKASVAQAGLEGKPAPKMSDVINAKKAEMRKAGNYSFINKGLFQKVVDDYGTALISEQKSGDYFVYKAVNAWGDSYRANEFYETDHKSIFDNGFMQVEDVDNNVIIDKFLEKPVRKTVSEEKIEQVGQIADEQVKSSEPIVNVKPEVKEVSKEDYSSDDYEAIDKQNVKDQLINENYYVAVGLLNEKPIKITKENVDRYLKKANDPTLELLIKAGDGKFYIADVPDARYLVAMDNSGIEYSSVEDIISDINAEDNKYLSPEEKIAAIEFLKQYGIDLSEEKEFVDPNQLSLFDDNSWKEEDNNDTCVPF